MRCSNSFAQFLYEHEGRSKVCRFLLTARNNHENPVIARNVSDTLDYLTNRSNGTISFLPKGKPFLTNDTGDWLRNGRQEGKPARTIQKLLSPAAKRLFCPKDWEQFSSLYNGHFESCGEVQLHPSSEIGDIYNHPRQSFSSSCMQGDEERDYLKFYEAGGDMVQIVTLIEDETLHARAIVWNIEGRLLCDRIYGAEKHQERIKAFIWGMGGLCKARQNYTHKTEFEDADGNKFERLIQFRYPTESVVQFPYLDTFTYGWDGVLSNYEDERCRYTYTSTEGNRQGDSRRLINGRRVKDSECVWSCYDDCYLLRSAAVRVQGEWYRREDVNEVTCLQAPNGDLQVL